MPRREAVLEKTLRSASNAQTVADSAATCRVRVTPAQRLADTSARPYRPGVPRVMEEPRRRCASTRTRRHLRASCRAWSAAGVPTAAIPVWLWLAGGLPGANVVVVVVLLEAIGISMWGWVSLSRQRQAQQAAAELLKSVPDPGAVIVGPDGAVTILARDATPDAPPQRRRWRRRRGRAGT